jgi:hypothetical protein
MHKICKKCGEQKELSLFYKHPSSKDGRDSKCIECAKANAISVRNARIDHYRQYDRDRGNRQDSGYLREYRNENPKKYKAHCAVNNAVRSGTLKQQPCEICAAEKSVAHHDDYDFPLVVRWLCQAHHKQWHAKNGEGKNG